MFPAAFPVFNASKIPKRLIAVSAVVGLGASLYMLYKKWNLSQLPAGPAPQDEQELFRDLKSLAARDEMVEYLKEDTVEALIDLTTSLCEGEYRRLVEKSRAARRAVFEADKQAYEQTVVELLDALNRLVVETSRKVAMEVGIRYEKFEATVEKLAEEKPGFSGVLEKSVAKLRKSAAGQDYHHLTQERLLEAYMFAVEEYPLYKPINPAYRRLIKDAVLEDRIQAAFEVEEEVLDFAADKKNSFELDSAKSNLQAIREKEGDSTRFSQESRLIRPQPGMLRPQHPDN